MIRFKVQSDKRSILVLSKALLLYILLQELHEGGLGLVKSLDHQTLGLVHLKETKGLVSSRPPIFFQLKSRPRIGGTHCQGKMEVSALRKVRSNYN